MKTLFTLALALLAGLPAAAHQVDGLPHAHPHPDYVVVGFAIVTVALILALVTNVLRDEGED
ncbi:MAG: hypothetical protein ACPGID_06550 [Rubricella sp.]